MISQFPISYKKLIAVVHSMNGQVDYSTQCLLVREMVRVLLSHEEYNGTITSAKHILEKNGYIFQSTLQTTNKGVGT